jgi:hypothetical protein
MGASSGWNLVARRPPRPRAASKPPARHLVSVPRPPSADRGQRDRTTQPRDAGTTRDAG